MKSSALIVSLLWLAAAGYVAGLRWPRVPLDMSANDPATVEALNAAVFQHVVTYGAIAILPPLVLFIVMRLARKS